MPDGGWNRHGRHEPDVGEINYPYLFDLIDSLGYDGWIGCEYRPRGQTLDGSAGRAAMGSAAEQPLLHSAVALFTLS